MNFWEFISRDWLKLIITFVILSAMVTGVYHIGDFIKITERIAINLSQCGK